MSEFLYEIKICVGAKIIADKISNTDCNKIPLNKKMIEGIIESERDLKIVFELKQIFQIKQYMKIKIIFTDK